VKNCVQFLTKSIKLSLLVNRAGRMNTSELLINMYNSYCNNRSQLSKMHSQNQHNAALV